MSLRPDHLSAHFLSTPFYRQLQDRTLPPPSFSCSLNNLSKAKTLLATPSPGDTGVLCEPCSAHWPEMNSLPLSLSALHSSDSPPESWVPNTVGLGLSSKHGGHVDQECCPHLALSACPQLQGPPAFLCACWQVLPLRSHQEGGRPRHCKHPPARLGWIRQLYCPPPEVANW